MKDRITPRQQEQIESLRDAVHGGLPAKLGRFIDFTLDAIERLEYSQVSRVQIQEYIDTLIDLIDVKVHSR